MLLVVQSPRFWRKQGASNTHRHHGGHHHQADRPAPAIGHQQGAGPGDQQGDAIGRDRKPCPQGTFVLGKDIGAIGIHQQVLGGRGPGDQQRQGGNQPQAMPRRGKGQGGNGRHEHHLAYQQPAAPPPQERQAGLVEPGCPEKLDAVGQPQQRHETDGPKVDSRRGQKGFQRTTGNGQGQTR